MKHKELIEKMTLEEKASLMSGRDFWQSQDIPAHNIPNMFLSDGPHGIRKQAEAADHLGLNASIPATCFPTAATVANSFNVKLAEEIGTALGEEAVAQKVNVLLGPGINMKRNPLCGRNFEYFSEDPYLAGKIAAGYIRGIQSNGISACVKHFACNNQEERRMVIDTIVDERTLREIYLTAFEIAVKEGKTKSIMSSYNMINGTHANENTHLLKDILRDEWGFEGVVVSDWGGDNDRVTAVKAGSDLQMPATGGESDAEIVAAVKNGTLSEADLDACADRMIELTLDTEKVFSGAKRDFDVEKHHELARRVAEESIVLLKNEDNILPLADGAKVAVIGDFAKTPRYQGAGSSIVNPTKLDDTMSAIGESPLTCVGYAQGFERYGKKNQKLLLEAAELSQKADVVLFYMGLDEVTESEGVDRKNIQVPQCQIDVLEAVYQLNKNIVVILSCGSAVEMPWLSMTKGLLHGYLGGQSGAKAMINVLTGKVNPSGKLAETYPLEYKDVSSAAHFPGKEVSVEYREGLYIGYRYYVTANVPVLFPFGYGLSYTTFAYEDLKIHENKVSFTIANTGSVPGAESAQLYVAAKGGRIFRPAEELKGFTKVYLEPGESKEVEIALDDKAFRYFNVLTNAWEVEGGAYEIRIGANALDIRLSQEITVSGTTDMVPYNEAELPSYFSGKAGNVSRSEFEKLLGHKAPDSKWDRSKPLGYNDTIGQIVYAKGWFAKFAGKIIYALYHHYEKKNNRRKTNMFDMVVLHQPFRGLNKMAGGALSMEMVDGLLVAVNGHLFRGIGKIIKGARRRKK